MPLTDSEQLELLETTRRLSRLFEPKAANSTVDSKREQRRQNVIAAMNKQKARLITKIK